MMRRARLYVEDVLRAIEQVVAFTEGMDEAAFAADARTQLAVLRLFEVMGEAAKRVPPDVRARAPGVPWREMGRMR